MMQDFRRQAERFGAEFVTDDVTRVDFSQRPFRVWVGDDEYRAEAVIVATGASARQLGLDSEQRLQGRGVSYCATCDAAFFRDKVVVVVGGGDSAMEEALFITRFASKVYLVHRREEFRASPIMVDRARANEKIELVLDKVVEEVLGDDKVTGVRLTDTVTGEKSETSTRRLLRRDRPRPEHGAVPRPARPRAGHRLPRHARQDRPRRTCPGVFAAGDVQDHVYRQAVTAAGSGLRGRARRGAVPQRAAARGAVRGCRGARRPSVRSGRSGRLASVRRGRALDRPRRPDAGGDPAGGRRRRSTRTRSRCSRAPASTGAPRDQARGTRRLRPRRARVPPRPFPQEDRIEYLELDVLATPSQVVTVRKSGPDGELAPSTASRPESTRAARAGRARSTQRSTTSADAFLDLLDGLYEEIDELEGHVEQLLGSRCSRTASRRAATRAPARSPHRERHARRRPPHRRRPDRRRAVGALPATTSSRCSSTRTRRSCA